MGATPSKHYTVPSKAQVHSKNVTAFVSKLHKVMKDPVYSDGVTVDSILEMVDDLAKVYAGRTKYIKAPRPVNGIAPVDTILFMPVPLNPASKIKPLKPKAPPISRRALSRDISVAGTSNSKSPCARRESYPIADELSGMMAGLVSIDCNDKVNEVESDIGDVHTVHEEECD